MYICKQYTDAYLLCIFITAIFSSQYRDQFAEQHMNGENIPDKNRNLGYVARSLPGKRFLSLQNCLLKYNIALHSHPPHYSCFEDCVVDYCTLKGIQIEGTSHIRDRIITRLPYMEHNEPAGTYFVSLLQC